MVRKTLQHVRPHCVQFCKQLVHIFYAEPFTISHHNVFIQGQMSLPRCIVVSCYSIFGLYFCTSLVQKSLQEFKFLHYHSKEE